MSCVIIGAGIAGLSAAYHLQKEGYKVTVYSSKNKKAASHIFNGILYKYPGRWGRKSRYSDDAYEDAISLIKEVEEKTGEKVIVSTGVIKKFTPRLKKFPDVVIEGENGYIKEAVTIDMQSYTKGLKELIGNEHFIEEEIHSLDRFSGPVVVACGYGVKELLQEPDLIYRKGQQFRGKKAYAESAYGSIVARGHISFLPENKVCLGSTYEKEFSDEEVNKEFVEKEITKKISTWYDVSSIKDKEFAGGVRVGQSDTYLPLVKNIGQHRYAFTALGSRGLLYHSYYGKMLAAMVKEDE